MNDLEDKIEQVKQKLVEILKDLDFPQDGIDKQLQQLHKIIYVLLLQEEMEKLPKDERKDLESTVQKIKDNLEASLTLLGYLSDKLTQDQVLIDFKKIFIKTLRDYLHAVISPLPSNKKPQFEKRVKNLMEEIEDLPCKPVMSMSEFEEKVNH